MMGNVMLKAGNTLYHLDPASETALTASDWCCGISLTHTGPRKPSLAVMSMLMKPFEGSVKYWFHIGVVLKPRQAQIPGRRMASNFERLLDMCTKNNPDVPLPKTITIMRDGLADDQLTEALREEVEGISSGISKWAKRNKRSWKPKIQFLVNPKQGIDDYCMTDANGNIANGQAPKPCLVINPNILSSNRFEFLLSVNPREQKQRPKRFIVLRDDHGLTRNVAGLKHLAEYILAGTWNW